MKKIFRRVLLSLVFSCLLGIGTNLQAGVVTVLACAFRPMIGYGISDQPTWGIYNPANLTLSSPFPNKVEFVAPLNLPDSVKIKAIKVYFIDTDPTMNFSFKLHRVNLSTHSLSYVASGNSEEVPASGHHSIIVLTGSRLRNTTVNNNLYAYALTITFSPLCYDQVQFSGIQIVY